MKGDIELHKNPYADYIAATIRAEKKEKALQEQKKLDFQKWLESEYHKTDLSGLMPYCMFCKYVTEKRTCGCDVNKRSSEAICNEAYSKMKEKLDK